MYMKNEVPIYMTVQICMKHQKSAESWITLDKTRVI